MLSFIVPFHNVEKYIEECIRSLYNQDLPYDEYEVIAVNDCSPDHSREIILRLQKLYPTLILIDHIRNKKQAGARNTGVSAANGEYIWFIDSDDYLKPNVLSNLLNVAIENELEILHFDYARVNIDNSIQEYQLNYFTEVVDGNTFFFDEKEIWWKKNVEVWRRLHKRIFLIENGLKFEEDSLYEDVKYSIEVFNKAQRVMHISETPYCYRLNLSSFFNLSPSAIHLIESVKLSLRCLELSENVIFDKRYIPVLNNFARYHFKEVEKILPTLNKKEQIFFYKQIKNLPIYQAKQILKLYKFIALKSLFWKFLFFYLFKH